MSSSSSSSSNTGRRQGGRERRREISAGREKFDGYKILTAGNTAPRLSVKGLVKEGSFLRYFTR